MGGVDLGREVSGGQGLWKKEVGKLRVGKRYKKDDGGMFVKRVTLGCC